MLCHSVKEIIDWVENTTHNTDMACALSHYLMSQGETTFEEASKQMCLEEQENGPH